MATTVITKNPIYTDQAAAVTTAPLWIQKILVVPSAAASVATFTYTEGGSTYGFADMVNSTKDNYELDFGDPGIHVPNLTISALTNVTMVYIYV